MKRKVFSVLVICLMVSMFNMSAFAVSIENDYSSDLLFEPIEVNDQVIKIIEDLKAQQAAYELNGDVQPMAPAPPLTYLEVYAAISTNYPQYEYFSDNQLRSVQDHGGGEMYIVTVELGYGHQRFARMNGTLLSSIQYQAIDLDNDSIIDGWFYWWDASNYESGNFSYQNTSSNYPRNTMSDSIYIQ